MSGNSWGQLFRVTTFGESHGPLIGAVIDGCPAGLNIDLDFIHIQMAKRKPGQSKLTTQRKESDQVRIVSGLFEGITTGTPLTGLIENEDNRSKDYNHIQDRYRPSHADFTYQVKYGHRDHRGGGRASARETAARVWAGAVAQLFLKENNIQIFAYVSEVGNVQCPRSYQELDLQRIYDNDIRCPDQATAEKMIQKVEEVRKDGDTIGGVITGVVKGCPAGLGEPVFDKLHADLGKALLSINAVKGFEYGSGFAGVRSKGSEHNDAFSPSAIPGGTGIVTTTNRSGGIQGGISNGMDIYFRVAFKPVATIMKTQSTVTQSTVTQSAEPVSIEGRGRHDPCVLPRATAIVEAMTAITLADHLLRNRSTRV